MCIRDRLCTDFGMLDGAALNLSGEADAQKALDWYLAEVLRRFEAADYKNLEFAGFYWMHETNYRSSLIRYASEKAQTLGSVSYTHLDVYKRQVFSSSSGDLPATGWTPCAWCFPVCCAPAC